MSALNTFKQGHTYPDSPDFLETFPGSAINALNWTVQTYASVRAGSEQNLFAANSVIVGSGVCQLRLSQNAEPSSLGAEIESVASFGYGLYEVTMRAASTAATNDAAGTSVSGGVCSPFLYFQTNGGATPSDRSVTEIDFVEVEGQFPSQIAMTSYHTEPVHETHQRQVMRTSDGFHLYSMLWEPTFIEFYYDGLMTGRHTTVVPTHTAQILLNHWGSNTTDFGGTRTVGVSRYAYVSRVAFYAL